MRSITMTKIFEQHNIIKNPNYTDRESYLLWISKWKDFYKDLSVEIYSVKQQIKEKMRSREVIYKNISHNILTEPPLWQMQNYREQLRLCATNALELRAEEKKNSWAMKLKAKELEMNYN